MCCSLSSLSLFETGYSLALANLGLAVPCLRLREIHCFRFSSAETTHPHYDFSLYAWTTDKSMKQHVVAVLKAIFTIILKEKRSPLLSKLEAICQREAVRRLSGLGQRCLQGVCLKRNDAVCTSVRRHVPVCSSVSCHRLSSMYLCVGSSDWTLLGVDSLCLSATLSIFFLVYGIFFF